MQKIYYLLVVLVDASDLGFSSHLNLYCVTFQSLHMRKKLVVGSFILNHLYCVLHQYVYLTRDHDRKIFDVS